MLRLCRVFQERQTLLKDALNHYLPQRVEVQLSRGGTAFWVRGPAELDAQILATEAARRGVLIEPVAPYYARETAPANVFRMSVTSLPADRIRPGVASLASVIREMLGSTAAAKNPPATLRGEALHAALAGSTLFCRTVYGEPFSIALRTDGTMEGVAGYANEDRDRGEWWVEDELWFRRWENWAYGEPLGLKTAIEGDQIMWFKPDGRFIDRGVIGHGTATVTSEMMA
jgi:GntR family transcriptional regulator/MocR family aminotransferase